MWETVRLGNVCEILDRQRKPITKRNRKSGPIPYYGATGVVDWVSDYIFDEPLILVGEDGAKWGEGERTAFLIEGKSWVNNHAHVIRPKKGIVLREWISHYLTAIDLSPWVTGLTIPKLNQAKLRSIPLPLPPLAEQKRIVERLDKAFAEIDKAQNANAKSERQLMVVLENAVAKLLITPKSTSELTELSEFLDETITGPFGSSLHKSDYTDNGVAVINPQNILNGEISTSNCNFISYEKAKDLSRYSLQVGDIVLGRRGEMGRCAVVDASEKKMICGTGCMILRAKSGCSPYYLAELIRSKYIRSVLEKNSIGMTMANLNQKILLNVKIPRDSYRNQIERVNTCRRLREFVDSAITIRKNKANKLTDIRRSILKQELTPSEAV